MTAMIGIDIGGTFTDLTAYDPGTGKLTFGKTTTTALPDEGAVSGLRRLIADGVDIRRATMLKARHDGCHKQHSGAARCQDRAYNDRGISRYARDRAGQPARIL